MSLDERWVPYDGRYEVSDLGRVRHAITGQVRRLTSKQDYLGVTLYIRGGRTFRSVHRMVLEGFVGPCPAGFITRHLNGNGQDNRLSNLAWGTPAENTADTFAHGHAPLGEQHHSSRLTRGQVATIRVSPATGVALAKEFGVSPKTISQVRRRETWAWL